MSDKVPTPPPGFVGEAILCPVDECDFVHYAPDLTVPSTALASVFGSGVMAAAAVTQRAHEIERVLGKHFAGHKAEEYLRTIQRLNTRAIRLPADWRTQATSVSAWTAAEVVALVEEWQAGA
jgi:hypothetical protein